MFWVNHFALLAILANPALTDWLNTFPYTINSLQDCSNDEKKRKQETWGTEKKLLTGCSLLAFCLPFAHYKGADDNRSHLVQYTIPPASPSSWIPTLTDAIGAMTTRSNRATEGVDHHRTKDKGTYTLRMLHAYWIPNKERVFEKSWLYVVLCYSCKKIEKKEKDRTFFLSRQI